MSFGRSRSNFFVNLSDHNTYTHQENLLMRQKKDFKFTATIESISLKEPVVSQKKKCSKGAYKNFRASAGLF